MCIPLVLELLSVGPTCLVSLQVFFSSIFTEFILRSITICFGGSGIFNDAW